MADRTPLFQLISGQVLTSALTEIGSAGNSRIRLGNATSLYLVVDYTRAGGSASGKCIIRAEVHTAGPTGITDMADVAQLPAAGWGPIPVLDSASFATGRMDAYPFEATLYPSATGTTRRVLGPLDVGHGYFARVFVADTDGAAPGTVAVYWRGTL